MTEADERKLVLIVDVARGERNIALLNIISLARALKVRPIKLVETIS